MARDIVVVGGSAGAVEALRDLVAELPAGLPAAVFAVIHIPSDASSALPRILARRAAMAVQAATDGEPIEHGIVYVAPPNSHMVIENGVVRLLHGPRENGHRPAIDPLFRSAAVNNDGRVIGVVLSGNLNDGSAGLREVRAAGGIAMTQDPHDALHSSMPRSAAEAADPQVVGSAVELGRAIVRYVTANGTGEDPMPSDDVIRELDVSELAPSQLHGDDQPGEPSGLSCPECNGGLWELAEGDLLRYRCRVGHAYTFEALVAEQGRALESSFWVALRTLEESAAIARRGFERASASGHKRTATKFREREKELVSHAERIRQMLLSGSADARTIVIETES